jgi:two-component system response regulator AtoC
MGPADHTTQIVARLARSERRLVATWNGGHLSTDLPQGGRVVIGRSSEANIIIDHASVSRRHATLVLDEPLSLEDHGSANGTVVDGIRLQPGATVSLRSGALIELGTVLVVLIGVPIERHEANATAESTLDSPMLKATELIEVASRSKLSLLLLGETGVGKEVLAARVHASSPRASGPFIKVNCAALVDSLFEAELFGYERGAFTGAVQSKPGLLEEATRGTLLLDEVGELPALTQAKLLRVLESGEVTRVGALKPRQVDVRFVSATNRDLKSLVRDGKFREDLYYRLDGLSIDIPPLRERPSELLTLARGFLDEAAAGEGRAAPEISPEVEATLRSHSWPGNVRELRNVMNRSLLFCTGPVLGIEHLRIEMAAGDATPPPPPPPPASTAALVDKRARVVKALEQALWNQSRAAQLLGVSARTLYTWTNELGIARSRDSGENTKK